MAAATKQEMLNRLTQIINVPPMKLGPGSTIPSALFDALLRVAGLDCNGSMPIRGKCLVEAAGLVWGPSFDSRHSESGGGSTVTRDGLAAMEKAITILIGRRGKAERDRLIDVATNKSSDNERFNPNSLEDARQRIVATIVTRQGQSQFRRSLLVAYDHRCAMTGAQGEWVLEAAHIVPYKGAQTNVLSNGLLLRSDFHTLFDFGLIGIRDDYTIVTTAELKETDYKDYEGNKILLPADKSARPSREALKIHRLNFGLES
jgi:hypothetical protein